MAKLKITLQKSLIGRSEKQRVIVKTLGLKKVNSQVIHEDVPQIRGMIKKVSHLVKVEEV
ncbi:MAG: 50S ribosomal protein L30 [Desulfotomaculum sp.]|nr:50S ribosomal protein L30 [Desulfotomaculum sp.]MCL0049618.1 50S ribosomal protein L30 [Peptococcaceae bacterium]MCL0062798.1 50S ribosomal protein L30 [Peptococcaceae bacterium]